MIRIDRSLVLLPALLAPGLAHAEAVPTAPPDAQPRPEVQRQLEELVRARQELQQSVQKQMADFDARQGRRERRAP